MLRRRRRVRTDVAMSPAACMGGPCGRRHEAAAAIPRPTDRRVYLGRDRVATVRTAMRGRLVRRASGGTSAPRGPRRAGLIADAGVGMVAVSGRARGAVTDRRGAGASWQGGLAEPHLLVERDVRPPLLLRDRDGTRETGPELLAPDVRVVGGGIQVTRPSAPMPNTQADWAGVLRSIRPTGRNAAVCSCPAVYRGVHGPPGVGRGGGEHGRPGTGAG